MSYRLRVSLVLLAGAVSLAACSFDPAGLGQPAQCGNGAVEAGEACDGADLAGQTCVGLGYGNGVLGCASDCRDFDVSSCGPAPSCGNATLDPGEDCDGPALGGATCSSLGLGGGTLGCTVVCTFDTAACTVVAICGNGAVEGAEECDDGNTNDGDGCDRNCRREATALCGNGNLDPGEECDDGDLVDCNGCSATCRLETCGNGVRECAEACDDGNANDDDACLNDCSIARCGDGVVQTGVEQCDGATIPADCAGQGFVGGTLGCAGDCTFDTAACTRADGEACTADAQCDGGFCISETPYGWPAGSCSRNCNNVTCPGSNGVCLQVTQNDSYCYQGCASSADCRPGYACFRDAYGAGETVCRPRCESDAECPGTGTCNIYVGVCDVNSTGTGDFGDACADSGDCRAWCARSFTGGYCTANCDLASGFCGPGGTCVDVFGGAWADHGICLDACSGADPCTRGGYTCQSTAQGNVCLE